MTSSRAHCAESYGRRSWGLAALTIQGGRPPTCSSSPRHLSTVVHARMTASRSPVWPTCRGHIEEGQAGVQWEPVRLDTQRMCAGAATTGASGHAMLTQALAMAQGICIQGGPKVLHSRWPLTMAACLASGWHGLDGCQQLAHDSSANWVD
jgi:hypothetical protein